jgi:outer membrane protein OmpA-like peptidoglycan-associated protein
MKKYASLAFWLILILLGHLSYAQIDRDKTLLANDMFKAGDFEVALDLYNDALAINPDNIAANFMSARCLVMSTCCKLQAISRFHKTLELDPTYNNKIFYYIGDAFHHTNQFDSAIFYYDKYKEELELNRRDYLGVDVDAEIALANRRKFECDNGREYLSKPNRIKIENLGGVINSEFEDYAPAISSGNNEIYFTSKREGSTGGNKNSDNKFFEDIWYSKLVGGKWTAPINVGEPINDDGHNSAISLSPNGKQLFVYSSENGGDIYYSDKNADGTWGKPQPKKTLNTEFVESSISITADGKMMFYTSNKPGGKGGKDIYYCDLNAAFECTGVPKNIGSNINSKYDEEAPFYDVTNNILYFSSKGHKGMGGYDLFESSYNEATNSWSEPVNLGIPVNSTDDDVFMSLTADGQTGYYATYKEDSYGGNDIYKIISIDKILEDEIGHQEEDTSSSNVVDSLALARINNLNNTVKTPELKTPELKTLKCKIEILLVNEQGVGINGKVEVKLNGTSKLIFESTTTNSLASFDFEYKNDSKIHVTSESNGFFFQNAVYDITKSKDGSVVRFTVKLAKEKEMVVRPLRNVYFGFDKHTLTPKSYSEIDKLYNMMVNKPNMKIEIAGHTDFIGGDAYNQQLSQLRANAVKNALVKKGIAANRIVAKGYGEQYPLATNDDELEGRELNRRTEFIIMPN